MPHPGTASGSSSPSVNTGLEMSRLCWRCSPSTLHSLPSTGGTTPGDKPVRTPGWLAKDVGLLPGVLFADSVGFTGAGNRRCIRHRRGNASLYRHSVFPPEPVRCAKTSPAVCRPLAYRPFRPVPKLPSVPGHSLTDAQRPGPQTPFPSTTALVPEGQRTLAEVSDLCLPPGQPARPSGASLPNKLQMRKSLFVPLTAAPGSPRPAAVAAQRIPHPEVNS